MVPARAIRMAGSSPRQTALRTVIGDTPRISAASCTLTYSVVVIYQQILSCADDDHRLANTSGVPTKERAAKAQPKAKTPPPPFADCPACGWRTYKRPEPVPPGTFLTTWRISERCEGCGHLLPVDWGTGWSNSP